MNNDTYNGYTNYETWLYALWIDNTEGLSDYWRGRGKELNDNYQLAKELEYDMDEQAEQWLPDESSVFADMMNGALSRVDWNDVADTLTSE